MDLFILGFACISLVVTLTSKPEKLTEESIKEEQIEE